MQFLLSKTFNFLFFNGMWLLCVLGRENWLWLSVTLILSYSWLLLARTSLSKTQLLLPALFGIGIDSFMLMSGMFEFTSPFLPLWLIMLWLVFASTLQQSLRWLGNRVMLTAILGAIAFPLNYSVGEKLGAVTFSAPYSQVIAVMASIWLLGLPLLFAISNNTLLRSESGYQNSPATNIKPASKFLGVLLLLVMSGVFASSYSNPVHAQQSQSRPELRAVGSARLRVLLWTVYDSTLYTRDGEYRTIEADMALEITYRRRIAARDLIEQTVEEWQDLDLPSNRHPTWLQLLESLWPDVSPGDTLTLYVDDKLNSQFYFNERFLGTVEDAEFTRQFLAIWLDENNSYPRQRAQLTGR